jgi:hypothetical protein
MAFEVYCDYCGKEIEGRFAKLEGERGRNPKQYFQYHGEECYANAVRVLENLATWAHRGEGSGLAWQLVDAPARGEGRATTQLGDPHIPIGEEYQRRIESGTSPENWLSNRAIWALRHGNLVTLEEVAQLPRWRIEALEGIGPKAMNALESAFIYHELKFRADDRETAEMSD